MVDDFLLIEAIEMSRLQQFLVFLKLLEFAITDAIEEERKRIKKRGIWIKA